MEGCIVSPFVIYILGIVNSLLFTSVVIAAVGLIFYFVCLVEEEIDTAKKTFKITVIALIISVFTPTKGTIIGMVVAKNVTYENAAKGTEVAKQSIDYLFDKIQKINNKED